VADYNQSGMLNGGNTWSNNQYFMSDGAGRFQWGGSEGIPGLQNFAQFKAAAHETGSISQSIPNTDDWLTGTPADTNPPPVDQTPPPPPPPPPPPENHLPLITSNGGGATASVSVAENTTAVTKVVATDSDTGQTLAYSIVPVASGGGADASKFVIDATTGALAFNTAPNFEAPTDALAAANVYDVTVQVSDNKGGIAKQAIAVTVTDQPETPPPPPPDDLVLRGGRGTDHLTGGDGNDQLYGGRGSDILVGHAGNDIINGNSGKDYLLLDGTMQDYTIAVTKQGVTITNSAGEVDTVKNVEVFHFSDGTNYLVGRDGLVQSGDESINKFLADSGVDQSYFSAVPTAGSQQQTVQAAASNAGATDPAVPQQTPSTPSASTDALWNAVDAASNNPAHADSALADLKQHLHDAFDHAGATGSVDELAALLPWTHQAWTHHE
jgi:Ca2+-binding RTX toxin-like protein